MNYQKNYPFCILMIVALLLPTISIANRRSRRKGGITKAFVQTPENPFITEPIQVASLDQISLDFDKSRGDISRKMIDPKMSTEPIGLPPVLRDQSSSYDFPQELRQATKDLEKVELIQPIEEEKITLQFEEADLQTFVQQISDIFNVTFISDDAIEPLPAGTSDIPTRALKGNKISFKTTSPVTRQQAWNLFITFLNISGFGIVNLSYPNY
jgi:hypothetical protein